jgi:hypothetical protein
MAADMQFDDDDIKSLSLKLVTNRFRLSLACFYLGIVTLFDPSIMIGMLTAWHLSEIAKAKRKKAEELCGINLKQKVEE